MNGAEFIRRLKKLGRKRNVAVRFLKRPGKGSHGKLYFGSNCTTIKDRKKELSAKLLAAMLKQLSLSIRDLS